MNSPNVLALALHRFLGDYLPHQRAFSVHTSWSYRDSLKLLLQFAAGPKRRVADLTVLDLTPAKIIAFLDHLEAQRGNDATTRNVRLSAIHSFFDYLGAGWPEHLDQARRVLATSPRPSPQSGEGVK
jgi:site-specific recombinase XerD